MGNVPVPLFARTFYFLRHGETESNRLKTIAGSIDVSLNPTGLAQARAAIELVRPLGVTHVTSSHLQRAWRTAEIVAGGLGLPHFVVPELAERSWGELEGKPQAERVPGAPPPPGAETAEQFVARIREGCARVKAEGAPLIVAHSGTFRVLCRFLSLNEPVDAIANCRPVRMTPPDGPAGAWRFDVL